MQARKASPGSETGFRRMRGAITEFICVFLFQFLGGLCASNSADSGISTAALGNGCALAVLIYASLSWSGAHLNPAVSTAMFLVGESQMTLGKWTIYCGAQLSGALLGAGFLRVFCPETAVTRNPFVSQGILFDGAFRNLAAVGLFEFMMTFTLVYVYCSVILDAKSSAQQYGPLCIGLVYSMGIYCAGPYTGASMNPARTVAAALVYWDFTGMWISILTILLGGVTGAFAYKSAYGIDSRNVEEEEIVASQYV